MSKWLQLYFRWLGIVHFIMASLWIRQAMYESKEKKRKRGYVDSSLICFLFLAYKFQPVSIFFWAGIPVNFFAKPGTNIACPGNFPAPSPIIKGTLGKETENILRRLKTCHNLSKLMLGNPATWFLKVRYHLSRRIIQYSWKLTNTFFSKGIHFYF